jgi:hypothetical protein
MRFTYRDINDQILVKYDKKLKSLNKEDQKNLVNTFYRFLYMKRPKTDTLNISNITSFLCDLSLDNFWFFYSRITEISTYPKIFKYFTRLHLLLYEKKEYRNMYKKVYIFAREKEFGK